MREVLTRRFKRAIEGSSGFDIYPDLIMMDGGRGQDRHIILTLEIKKMDNMRTSNIIKEGESILVNMKDKVFTIYAYVLWSK